MDKKEILATIEAAIVWADLKPSRTLNIDYQDRATSTQFKCWCYDYDLQEGQFIRTLVEAQALDITKAVEKQERAKLAELLAKYPPSTEADSK